MLSKERSDLELQVIEAGYLRIVSFDCSKVCRSINRSCVRMLHGIRMESLLQITTLSVKCHRPSSSTPIIRSSLPTSRMEVFRYGRKEAPVQQTPSLRTLAEHALSLSAEQVTYTSTTNTPRTRLISGVKMQVAEYRHCLSVNRVGASSSTQTILCTTHYRTLIA